jgi:hypothetical protein
MIQRRVLIFVICLAFGAVVGGGRYAWQRHDRAKTSRVISDLDVAKEMRLRAAQAVRTAASEYQTVLDYRPESVEKVEMILGRIHDRHRQSPLSNSEVVKESLKWGAYVGEVIKTVQPARWGVDSQGNGPGSLPLVYRSGGESFPVLWSYKRITNGDEDNVWHKFTLLVVDRDLAGGYVSRPEAEDAHGASDKK